MCSSASTTFTFESALFLTRTMLKQSLFCLIFLIHLWTFSNNAGRDTLYTTISLPLYQKTFGGMVWEIVSLFGNLWFFVDGSPSDSFFTFTDDPTNWINWLFGLITVFGPSNLVWDIRIRNFNFWSVHCFTISDPDGRIGIQFSIWEVDVCCYFLTLISSLRCPASLISQTPVTTWPDCASVTSMSNYLSW